jgi:quercetin dioxygenase-like cupin family protein
MKTLPRTFITVAVTLFVFSTFAQTAKTQATFIEHAKVAAAFAKGMPLIETNNFKVHASRRDTPGVAEIHARDTDIIYVLEGSATFVTGGKATEPKTIAPDELRGREIEGGQTRQITKGDVIIVPSGVPHWFKEVNGPLLYYVVKVTSAENQR